MKRLILALTLALTGCRNPAAPEVIPQCTLTTNAGFTIHLCYRPCPIGADSFASGAQMDYTTAWLCT